MPLINSLLPCNEHLYSGAAFMKSPLFIRWLLVVSWLLLLAGPAQAEIRNFSIDISKDKIEPALKPYMQDQWIKNTKFNKVEAKWFRVESFSDTGIQISCRVRIQHFEDALVDMLKVFDTSVRVQLILKPYLDLKNGYIGVKVERTWITDATDIGKVSFVKDAIETKIKNALEGKDVFSRSIPAQVYDALQFLRQNKVYINGLFLTTNSTGLKLKGSVNYPGQLNVPEQIKVYFDGGSVSSTVQNSGKEYEVYKLSIGNETPSTINFKISTGGGNKIESFSVESGKTRKFTIRSEKGKKPKIAFDSNYAAGLQEKVYSINKSAAVTFKVSGNEIIIY